MASTLPTMRQFAEPMPFTFSRPMRGIEPQAAQGRRLGCCNGAALVGSDLTSDVFNELDVLRLEDWQAEHAQADYRPQWFMRLFGSVAQRAGAGLHARMVRGFDVAGDSGAHRIQPA